MPIYRIHNRNILFIHVPKTGGTSVEKFLETIAEPGLHNKSRKLLRDFSSGWLAPSLAMQHFDRKLLEGVFPNNFIDYAFMIVRHPVDRLISEYRHSRTHGRLDSRLPFNVWAHMVLRIARWEPHFRNNHFLPQANFRCFDADVYHFEDGIEKIILEISSKLELSKPEFIPHEKKSYFQEINASESTINLIRKIYKEDFIFYE
jgi:hypothetical protein